MLQLEATTNLISWSTFTSFVSNNSLFTLKKASNDLIHPHELSSSLIASDIVDHFQCFPTSSLLNCTLCPIQYSLSVHTLMTLIASLIPFFPPTLQLNP
ncbi:hypothetical protein PHAVU_007G015900 [Phaseolus vulgaris]|uniref:Uncharacterized protein n=1 Tax=Phaseolus vulgaris TaxID=3885 RepID=V7BAD3_PHAVU|nr:hypothetical protein PHAVU_007G015900g [Phaseolus vulgaris]ESW14769.1 hypothetical protein PHAVU_007G015900g [Phaseolus vulgaris]